MLINNWIGGISNRFFLFLDVFDMNFLFKQSLASSEKYK